MLDNKKYPPNMRDSLQGKSEKLKEINNKSKINLPDPKDDDIVVNNISSSEFDYTEK